VPRGATVAEALECLRAAHPALTERRFATAVNEEYAAADRPLAEEDELALIPPVSGG